MTVNQIYVPNIATEERGNDYFYGQVQFEIEKNTNKMCCFWLETVRYKISVRYFNLRFYNYFTIF